MVQIKLPDGSVKDYPEGVSPREVAQGIGKRLAEAAVAAMVGDRVVDLDRPVENGDQGPLELRILTPKDRDALGVLRHSTAHIMARAIMRLHQGVRLAFGPTTTTGFYYDVDIPGHQLSEGDFPAIEAEMARILQDAEPFERFTLPADDARQFVADLGQTYKVEHIDQELHKYGILSFYRQGEFVDLCRGPHIPHAGKVGAFKLLSIAGAYWKGQTDRPMLQRVYGTAFFEKKDLEAHLNQLEEAKKRDHRRLGRELGLFTISPLVGPGLILWMPKGAIVRGILESFIKEELVKRGYQPVYTPHIGKVELYQTSGHYPYYNDAQFPTIKMPAARGSQGALGRVDLRPRSEDGPRILLAKAGIPERMPEHSTPADDRGAGGISQSYSEMSRSQRIAYVGQMCDFDEYLLKPMNCPHHIQIYAAQPRSYRELPLRLAEFGTVYRYEQSGEISGLTRVRGFTQDDAHLFCTHEQVRGEFRSTMEVTQFFLNSCLGLSDYRVRLSKGDPSDPKYQGAAGEIWKRAEEDIRAVLVEMGLPYEEASGEAAFYGPKADFIVRDCIGRAVAARHGPARLRIARALRPGIRRAGQPAAPAGDDSPSAPGEHGALHGDLDRAFRRRVPALAGAGAGACAADFRQGRPLCAASPRPADGRGLPRQRRSPCREDRRQDPRRTARKDPGHACDRRQGSRELLCLLPRPDRRRFRRDAAGRGSESASGRACEPAEPPGRPTSGRAAGGGRGRRPYILNEASQFPAINDDGEKGSRMVPMFVKPSVGNLISPLVGDASFFKATGTDTGGARLPSWSRPSSPASAPGGTSIAARRSPSTSSRESLDSRWAHKRS